VLGLFYLSGFPALLYQIVWQRSLFTIFGSNIESVTIIVAAFMLGLGAGSILGGQLSRIGRLDGLIAFGAIELLVAAFGWQSLEVFHWAGGLDLGASTAGTGLLAFGLLVLPTMGMGATLPVLTRVLVARLPNVGRSLGFLYFVNTLGSASAALVAAAWLLPRLGQAGVVSVAVGLNLSVGCGALGFAFLRRFLAGWARGGAAAGAPEAVAPAEGPGRDRLSPTGMLGLSFASGFLALSYEIIWFRLLAFLFKDRAEVFAVMLGMFLIGIAAGALLAGRICRKTGGSAGRLLRALAVLFVVANTASLLIVPAMGFLAPRPGLVAGAYVLVAVGALLLGPIFPLISHLGIRPDLRAGEKVSFVYVANIVGSVSGSLVTGLILMDALNIAELNLLVSLLGASIGLGFLLVKLRRRVLPVSLAVVFCLSGAWMWVSARGIYEKLLYKDKVEQHEPFTAVIENRSGVITVAGDGTVYGGGVYDGRFSVDLVDDVNGIFRPFSLGAFHPAPREVLMIGLSSGSWAQVVAHHPRVEKLTVVEINPGYLQLISESPVSRSLLDNPRVEIVMDDGRRWLRRSPDRRFDAVVMNVTFHWRSHSTNMLSTEFLHLVRSHLRPGGVVMYNTTASLAAMRTGLTVFASGYRLYNVLVVGDAPIEIDADRLRRQLGDYSIDGRKVLDLARDEDRRALEELLAILEPSAGPPRTFQVETRESVLARSEDCRLITDDNMLTEWGTGCE
jgi:spermidine synthase